MRIIRVVLISLFGVVFLQTTSAQVNEHKKTCGLSQASAASKALADAKAGIFKAIKTFDSPTPTDLTRQTKWFGVLDSNSATAVRKVYEAALTQASISQFWCPVVNDLTFRWDVGDLAAVHPSTPGAMFLTPSFFSKPSSGSDTQSGILIHELTHLGGVGLRPEVYGTTASKALAVRNPAQARNNSDSYEYYVEDLLFGIP
jgi:peptidyl-Lys metalloendopeptidase